MALVTTSHLDGTALRSVLRRQRGLVSTSQAGAVGLSQDSLERRTSRSSATWQRVLPRVYAAFVHELGPWQRAMAALLYAGPTAMVTGLAALEQWEVRYLPAADAVDVLVPRHVRSRSRGFVRVRATTRLPAARSVNGLRLAPAPRATVDAAAGLTSYDAVVAIVTGVVQRRLATVEQLVTELASRPVRGAALLRQAVGMAKTGARSAAEARALALFRAAGLPEPLVNRPVLLPGRRVRVPDFRWGRLVVELDSREWHWLAPGSWEETHRRRRELQAAGYLVLVVTPYDLQHEPERVVNAIRAALG